MLMVDPAVKARFSRLQTRWRDPLLTTLTIMLAVMLFVLAPLQATGIVKSDTFAIALILISTAALFVVSGNLLTIVAILVAIGFSAIAAALRVRHLTLALYFDATAWALLGVSVGWVVARAVFGPGDVTYHRIMGAILLYLDVGAIFVALYTFVGLKYRTHFPAYRWTTALRFQAISSTSASSPLPRPATAKSCRLIQLPVAFAISKASLVSFIRRPCWRGLCRSGSRAGGRSWKWPICHNSA
jgi:hypothetical protein